MGSSQSRETHRQEQGAARSGHGQADGTLAAGLWAEPGGWQWSLGSLSPPAHARTQLAPKGANQCGGWRGPGRAGDTEQCTAQLPPPPPPGREISAPHPREGFDLQPPVTLTPLQLGPLAPGAGGERPQGACSSTETPPQPLRIGVSSLGNRDPKPTGSGERFMALQLRSSDTSGGSHGVRSRGGGLLPLPFLAPRPPASSACGPFLTFRASSPGSSHKPPR